jgi:hypothetical protein
VQEYLDTLDDEAFGAATITKPKFTAHADPASQWTAARKGPAFFAYSTNYLIDTDHSIIAPYIDCFAINEWGDDTDYGSSDNLVWLTTTLNASLAWPGFDCAAHTASKMNLPLQQRPKTSENSRSSSR